MTRYWHILVCWLVVWSLYGSLCQRAWADIELDIDDKTFLLSDGSHLELTETAVILYATGADEQTTRWTVSADKPRQAILFEIDDHSQGVMFFSTKPDQQGEFRALRVSDGRELWRTPIRIGNSTDLPVTSVFVAPWIYLGRGTWLEQLNPRDGTIVNRYPMREIIQDLYVSNTNGIEVLVETFEIGSFSILFQENEWFPHITVSSSLTSSTILLNRAAHVMPDFAGTLDPSAYQGYLDLHRVKTERVSPEDIIAWRHFDLHEAEARYQKAAERDLANPYLSLYWAFALYYQGKREAATATFNDALQRSENYWDESLRLGAICDSLGRTTWADAFYTQGTTRYFHENPAPPQEASLNEVLSLFLQQQSSVLFANGYTERALQLVEIRRRLFPYTEGDNHFSRHYAEWLQQTGQPQRAQHEQQRIDKRTLLFDRVAITPFDAWNVLLVTLIFLAIVILKNDVRHWTEFVVLMLTLGLVDAVATFDLFGTMSLPVRILIHAGGFIEYIFVMALLRKRRSQSSQSLGSFAVGVAMSSYIVVLRGILPAYYLGYRLSGSQLGAKCVEVLFILGFVGIYLLLRRRSLHPPVLRYSKLLLLGLIIYSCWGAWLHYWGAFEMLMMNFPQPWGDKGHPNWVVYVNQRLERAEFRRQDVQFLRGLAYQLLGDASFAEELYQPLTHDARALNNLGVLLAHQTQEDTARKHFQHALQQDPTCIPARYNLEVLTGNQAELDLAHIEDSWLPQMYQQYAPDRLWVINPAMEDWCRIFYRASGGFWYKSFLELMIRFTNPAELFQAELQLLQL